MSDEWRVASGEWEGKMGSPSPQSQVPSPIGFEVLARDPGAAARRGRMSTPHGTVETPAFMPVGTQAAVKGMTPDQVRSTGTEMVLADTYHLTLRPGEDVVARLG